MRRSKKRYIIFFCSVIFLFILASLGVLYIHRKTLFPYRYEPKKFTGNIFGKPNGKTDYQFPLKKPLFRAKVSSIQSPSLIQQAVTMYHSDDTKGVPVFQRSFYEDGFHGRVLTYHFASDSASFQQSGSLGTIGCAKECTMVWSNFYTWDVQQQAFILDNASHQDFFQQLLITYQALDKRGCTIAGDTIVPDQADLTLTQLYTKHPTLSWYCNKSQGLLPTNLVFFLKAEKAIQEVIAGKNIGSNDIKDISL